MSEPKTYYGPWIRAREVDAPVGSIWEIEALIGPNEQCVAAHDGFMMVGGRPGRFREYPTCRFRRVWPPGSIPAEPRPTVDVMCSDIARRWPIWVLSHGIKPVGPLNWYSVTLEPGDTFPLLYLGNAWIGSLCYPAQRLKNGTLAPVPWFDSGCTTE